MVILITHLVYGNFKVEAVYGIFKQVNKPVKDTQADVKWRKANLQKNFTQINHILFIYLI